MNRVNALHHRLAAITHHVKSRNDGLAVLGLGSAGAEIDRMDAYSDLDFFVIVRPSCKPNYLENLDWLRAAHPVAWAFRNTPDGYKLLYEDGIFCELAVFEPHEMTHIPYAEGRFLWKAANCPADLGTPTRPQTEPASSIEWNVGELITNLYVGLCRYRRGEKTSAFRFVQVYAVDRVMTLLPHVESPQPGWVDPFQRERRVEQRFDNYARQCESFMQGVHRTPESARALLAWTETHFEVHPAMHQRIEALLQVSDETSC